MSALIINTAELRFATSGGFAPFGQGVNFVKKIFNFDVYQQTSIHTFWDTTKKNDTSQWGS